MFFGLVLVIAGVTLALWPVGSAHFANKLRHVPYSDDEGSVSYFRLAGCVMIVLGLLVAAATA